MKHIYYLMAIVFILFELVWIYNPEEKAKEYLDYKKLKKENKDKKWDDYPEDYKSILKRKIFSSLFMLFWLFGGLFTYNWIAFLAVLSFNFIIIAPLTAIFNKGCMFTMLHWLNSVVGAVFGIFVILNSYKLHIDLVEFVKSLLYN